MYKKRIRIYIKNHSNISNYNYLEIYINKRDLQALRFFKLFGVWMLAWCLREDGLVLVESLGVELTSCELERSL